MQPKVLILMSTYNGERYLAEQIESLYAQIGVDIHILVRDDGSQDATIPLLLNYQQSRGRITILQKENIGAAYSFYELIRYAVEEMSEFDYYAFSDQDDVWFNDKLCSSINLMEESDNKYKLSWSDQLPTDADCNIIQLRQQIDRGSIGANIVSNRIAGCVQVYNRNLFVKLNVINSAIAKEKLGKPMFFHDSWGAAVAYALGAAVIHDTSPRMYYRQHGNNVVGAGENGRIRQIENRIMRYLKNKGRSKSMKCEYIRLCLWSDVKEENKKFVDLCANYRHDFSKRLHLLGCKQLYEYGLEENIAFSFWY